MTGARRNHSAKLARAMAIACNPHDVCQVVGELDKVLGNERSRNAGGLRVRRYREIAKSYEGSCPLFSFESIKRFDAISVAVGYKDIVASVSDVVNSDTSGACEAVERKKLSGILSLLTRKGVIDRKNQKGGCYSRMA